MLSESLINEGLEIIGKDTLTALNSYLQHILLNRKDILTTTLTENGDILLLARFTRETLELQTTNQYNIYKQDFNKLQERAALMIREIFSLLLADKIR
jgi:hypothetical protein